MSPTASTINGRMDGPAESEAELGFVHVLGRMDGSGLYAYSLWQYPDGVDFDDVDIDAASAEYLQCAGSADALTIELRKRSGSGYDHWVLATAPITGEPNLTITWDGDFFSQIHPEEVFSSDQAAPLFEDYYRTGHIPDSVPRRRL